MHIHKLFMLIALNIFLYNFLYFTFKHFIAYSLACNKLIKTLGLFGSQVETNY